MHGRIRGGDMFQLENKLRSIDNLQTLWDGAKATKKVVVTIPKFKLEQTIGLNDNMEALGMKNMFADPRRNIKGGANFSPINGKRNLFVSAVIQKAFIEVNEEGSEAAAATAVIMRMTKSGRPRRNRPKVFRADRPFMFFLRDKLTGILLFQGRVMDPTA